MIKKMLIVLTGLISLKGYAQDFQGYRTGNFTGVNGAFTNPANIADSRYYFDVNLLSASTLGANNKASYKLKNFSETFKGENLRDKLFGDNLGPTSGVFSLDLHGPSAMYSIDNKNSISLTTRARMFVNVIDFDAKLFDQISNGGVSDPSLPYTITTGKNMRFAINGWSELGGTYGRVLMDKGSQMVKAGVTLKYLAGAVNGYVNMSDFRGTIGDDAALNKPYLSNTTGRIATGFSGERVAGFEASELFKMRGYGFGTDVGFIYEWRPAAHMQTTEGVRLEQNYKKLYKLKIGVAILDLGTILYKRDAGRSGEYDININNGERMYLDTLENVDVDDLNGFFDRRPSFFSPVVSQTQNEYNVSLPTTLQIEADYLINDGYYINLSSQVSLSDNKTKLFNNRTYSGITVTPRYEDKLLGFYLPINYNGLTGMNVGLSARIGPLFIGSGSLLTALFGSSKQADVHFGLRFGELK